MHTDKASETDFLASSRVEVAFALHDLALVDSRVCQLPILFNNRLECHADHRLRRIGSQLDAVPVRILCLFFRFRLLQLIDGGHRTIERAGQVIGHAVQRFLHTLILIRRTHHHWRDLQGDRRIANDLADFIHTDFGLFQQLFHHGITEHGESLEHLVTSFFRLFFVFSRNGFTTNVFTVFAVKVDRLHRQKVDDPLECRFTSHRQLQRNGNYAELFTDLRDHLVRIGTGAVHLVDEGDSRNFVALHLAIDGQRLALDTTDGAENEDCAVENAQRSFDFNGEVDVPRGIDDVDRMIIPMDLRCRSGDGNPFFPFEFHEVHRRADFVLPLHFVNLVDSAGVEQDAFGERGLTGVDVGRNTDVAYFFEIHGVLLFLKSR